jgi:hypothetical protein
MGQVERLERLQLVVRHTLGISSLSDEELRAISDSISCRNAATGDETSLQFESSLSTFSRQLEQKLGDAQHDIDNVQEPHVVAEYESADDVVAEFCRSPSPPTDSTQSFLHLARAMLPSREIAEHLARTCFDKVQCNSFYAQERWTFDQIGRLYEIPSTLRGPDIPLVATLLMIMALGSQFSPDRANEPLGHHLYEHTTSVIP